MYLREILWNGTCELFGVPNTGSPYAAIMTDNTSNMVAGILI